MPGELTIDLEDLGLKSGEALELTRDFVFSDFTVAGQKFNASDAEVPLAVHLSRTTNGWAIHLNFLVELRSECIRCLGQTPVEIAIDHFEIDQPGAEELESPYVSEGLFDLGHLATDSVILDVPLSVLCNQECKGICPQCGVDLNNAEPDHRHESEPDPRWSKLDNLFE